MIAAEVDLDTHRHDVAVGASGDVHVVYGTESGTQYATRLADGSWETSQVGPSGGDVHVFVDGAGQPQVVFASGGLDGKELHHAHRDAEGAWKHESVAKGNIAWFAAAWGPNTGHVVFFDTSTTTQHATGSAAAPWSSKPADVSFPWLQPDRDGKRLHASFVNGFDDALVYAVVADEAWKMTTVDDGAWLASSALAVDAEGGVHISFVSKDQKRLRYAHGPGDWVTEDIMPLPSGKVDGVSISARHLISIDAEGRPHVLVYAGPVSFGVRPLKLTDFVRVAPSQWTTKDIGELDSDGGATVFIERGGAYHATNKGPEGLTYHRLCR